MISQYLCGCGDILDYIRLFPILIYLSQTVTVKMKFEKYSIFCDDCLLNQNLWRAEKKKWIPVCIKEQKYQLFSRTLVKTIELYLQFLCPATHFEKIQVETSPSLKNIFLRKLKEKFLILQRLFSSSWSISQNSVIPKIYVHTVYYGAIFSKSQRLVFKFLAFVYWSTPSRHWSSHSTDVDKKTNYFCMHVIFI